MMTSTVLAQHRCSKAHSGFYFKVDYDEPGNMRSDTLDVTHMELNLDFTAMDQQTIRGRCRVFLTGLMDDVSLIRLDLEGLSVDSVSGPDGPLAFAHSGSHLSVYLPTPLNMGSETWVEVVYGGNPITDSSWGGFYTTLGYAYNMGVGFDAEPHNFGRCWFPCFDNFVERSTLTFHVLTNEGRTAYCNGLRTSVQTVGADSLLTTWEMTSPIPSYLTSIAVSDYVHTEQTFGSIAGDIPVWLISKGADSTEMKQSFIHLLPWLDALEECYGNHVFPKVGFVGVPFNAGAMEHATNIAYPKSAYQGGSLASETLIAHEIAHHWWGDNTTCRTAEDMWLNEGWASYSEALFLEKIYGQIPYINYVKANHKDVLLNAHENDGGYYAVSGVPHAITYGSHVYNKGADMIHNLRTTMGDSLFFSACRSMMAAFQFTDIGTEDLKNHFQGFTNRNLDAFFNQSIYNSGFAGYRISRWWPTEGGIEIEVEQSLHHAPALHQDVPMLVRMEDQNGNIYEWNIIISDLFSIHSLQLPANVELSRLWLNDNEGISQAVLAENKYIQGTGTHNFSYAMMDATVATAPQADSVLVRVESHWVNARSGSDPNVAYTLSADRWWSVHLPADATLSMNGTVRYYGNEGMNAYYDPTFFALLADNGYTEDSLILFFRPHFQQEWQEYNGDYTLNTQGSASNWMGRIEVTGMQSGDYCWGVRGTITRLSEPLKTASRVWFTEQNSRLTVLSEPDTHIAVMDNYGRLIWSGNSEDTVLSIPAYDWAPGLYHVHLHHERHNQTFTCLKP
jgi:hypothetical protein